MLRVVVQCGDDILEQRGAAVELDHACCRVRQGANEQERRQHRSGALEASACGQLRAKPHEQRSVQDVERGQQGQLRIDRCADQCLRR